MKRDLFTRVALIVVGFLLMLNLIASLLSTTTSTAQAQEGIKKFEYKVVPHQGRNAAERQQELNSYGEQGWELLEYNINDGCYYFKR